MGEGGDSDTCHICTPMHCVMTSRTCFLCHTYFFRVLLSDSLHTESHGALPGWYLSWPQCGLHRESCTKESFLDAITIVHIYLSTGERVRPSVCRMRASTGR